MSRAQAWGGRRCHLILSPEVWKALTREAARQGLRPSHVAQSVLASALDLKSALPVTREREDRSVGSQRGRHLVRVALDDDTWGHLAGAAGRRWLSVPQFVRKELMRMVRVRKETTRNSRTATTGGEGSGAVESDAGKVVPVIEF